MRQLAHKQLSRPAVRGASTGWLPVVLALGCTLSLSACVSQSTRSVDLSPPEQVTVQIAEENLLDIGVAVFDPSVPEDIEAQIESGVVPGVREAEATFIPYFLKSLLQSTGNWGAVRVIPRWSNAVDLSVVGRIVDSTGEYLRVNVGVIDATGRIWFNQDYDAFASRYAYDSSIPQTVDPFQQLYKTVADDLLAFYQSLTADDISYIRRTAQLRFAQQMVPEAYGEYLEVTDDSTIVIRRLPAEGDPMFARIQRVREREYMFIDTLDQHYTDFYDNMRRPYQEYRKATYEESIELNRLQRQSRTRKIMGATAIAGGIAAQSMSDSRSGQAAGYVSVLAGAKLLKDAFSKSAESKLHVQTIEQLGQSLETELTPHSIELENQALQLTGTVDQQFDALRSALSRLHREDLGLPVEE